jgi:hypothetical protein
MMGITTIQPTTTASTTARPWTPVSSPDRDAMFGGCTVSMIAGRSAVVDEGWILASRS